MNPNPKLTAKSPNPQTPKPKTRTLNPTPNPKPQPEIPTSSPQPPAPNPNQAAGVQLVVASLPWGRQQRIPHAAYLPEMVASLARQLPDATFAPQPVRDDLG